MRRVQGKTNAASTSTHEALQDDMGRYFGYARKAGQFHSRPFDPLDVLGGDANDHIDRPRHGMHCFDSGHCSQLWGDLGAACAPLEPNHEIGHLTSLTIAVDNRKSGDGTGRLQLGEAILCGGAG